MYEELNYLPQMLNAKELQELLGISQSSTYDLMHREDFPTGNIDGQSEEA